MRHVHTSFQLRTATTTRIELSCLHGLAQPNLLKHTNTAKCSIRVIRIGLKKKKKWSSAFHWTNTFDKLFQISLDMTIKCSLLRWHLTNDIDVLNFFFCTHSFMHIFFFFFFKGLRQRQAVLQHSEHQKQLWTIRVQLSWPYAEALETWSSGTSLWVGVCCHCVILRALVSPCTSSGRDIVASNAAQKELRQFCRLSADSSLSCFYLLACRILRWLQEEWVTDTGSISQRLRNLK